MRTAIIFFFITKMLDLHITVSDSMNKCLKDNAMGFESKPGTLESSLSIIFKNSYQFEENFHGVGMMLITKL